MATPTKPHQVRPKTFCPNCKRRGIIVLRLPSGSSRCFECIRKHNPIGYQNIVKWVNDHPPIEPG